MARQPLQQQTRDKPVEVAFVRQNDIRLWQ
jgi:hypothetical protein